MEKLVVNSGNQLLGDVDISGAKNAALPLLASSILAEGEYCFSNVPDLLDIKTMLTLLEGLCISSKFKGKDIIIKNDGQDGQDDKSHMVAYDLVKKMRASILVLGPLLAKTKKAKISFPGGCAIGERPIDQHVKALIAMGAHIDVKHGYIEANCDYLKGCDINFDMITVTGTENIVMASVLAKGETVIYNAAQEPEVVDLCNLLRKMGAQIEGDGSNTIRVKGVEGLEPASYRVMGDRIEASTFLCALAAAGGDIILRNAPAGSMSVVVEKLLETGLEIHVLDNNTIRARKEIAVKSADIITQPYPGFPTDMQAQFMAVMSSAAGVSVITEGIFENRFMHVAELKRMGADIVLKDHSAIVKGVRNLTGTDVVCTDLRAGAGLVVAALLAEGRSNIHSIYHIERGYDSFDEKLRLLGADIKKVESE